MSSSQSHNVVLSRNAGDELLFLLHSPYCRAVLDHLNQQKPIIASLSDRSRLSFQIGKNKQSIPSAPGVYVFLNSKSMTPIYAGEAGDLRQRVSYHCRNNKDSNQYSTLKKLLRTLHPSTTVDGVFVCQHYVIKYATIPFGRKEVEAYLHQEWQLNTKK
jgi:hypothetical protein